MKSLKIARAFAAALVVAGSLVMGGCDKKDDKGVSTSAGGDKPLTVGFIYIGTKDDYGYSQAHHEGAMAVAKMPGVKVVEQESVQETDQVVQSMEGMINNEDAKLIFPTSFGYYDPYMKATALKYPNLTFLHCGGRYKTGDPGNCGSYFGYIDEAVYMSGIASGGASKTGKLGFVAAIPIPQVRRNINAYLLGARTMNPKATVSVIFTGGWSKTEAEIQAVNSLADQGADVVTCHVDSPKAVLETAKKRGMMTCGYHANGSAINPETYLTGAEWNWAPIYIKYVETIKAGKKPDEHVVRGGLKDGFVKTSPLGPKVTAASKKKIDEATALATAGKLVIFKGPLMDNAGKEVIPAGKEMVQTDDALEGMDYLVDGVLGSTK
ncbi:MAG: transporter substrate-binding protein [Phycisphaerales bacterium]|jgi:basic membrane protein A|nr:transporter substrate-binding protein [Phycisphaerales bacterium]